MSAPPLPQGRSRAELPLRSANVWDPLAGSFGSPSLLSVVADELRAPLNSMLAGAEFLVEHVDTLDANTVREMVFAIRGSTIGMVELVENLLCASSIRAGRCALQPRACGPRDLLTEVQLLTTPMLHPLRQGLRLVIRGRIPGIAADPRRIGQVLLNLISNASK